MHKGAQIVNELIKFQMREMCYESLQGTARDCGYTKSGPGHHTKRFCRQRKTTEEYSACHSYGALYLVVKTRVPTS